MKLYHRKEFLELPPNTVFSKYEPQFFNGLEIKLETLPIEGSQWGGDFYSAQIVDGHGWNGHCDMLGALNDLDDGKSIEMTFDVVGRDGMFTDGLFAVWDKDDVKRLIERLKECL